MNNISKYKLTKWRKDALISNNDLLEGDYMDVEQYLVCRIQKLTNQIIELTQELMDRNLISKKD